MTQLKALKIFEKAYTAARELNNFISTTKFTASNAVGSTMGFFYNQKYTVDSYVNQENSALKMVIYEAIKDGQATGQKSLDPKVPRELVKDREGYIRSQIENPFAFEQCMYDLNKELLEVLNKYYPYEKPVYKDRRDELQSFLPNGNVLDAETIDNIHRETSQHLLTCTDGEFNPTDIYTDPFTEDAVTVELDNKGEKIKHYLTNREYYLYRFPIELFELMRTGNIPPLIARYLGFSYSDYKDRTTGKTSKQLHISINLAVEQTDKNSFTDAWAQLATMEQRLESLEAQAAINAKIEYINKYIDNIVNFITVIEKNMNLAAISHNDARYNALMERYMKLDKKYKAIGLKDNFEADASNVNTLSLPEDEQGFMEAEVKGTIKRVRKEAKLATFIAKGLFLHNYYKTGYGVGPNSFIQFTPLEVKKLLKVGRNENVMSYLDFIDVNNLDKLSLVTNNGRIPKSIVEFGYMFALNHVDNYKLVHRMPSSGNQQYFSYFVATVGQKENGDPIYQQRRSFEIDLSSSIAADIEANKNFLISQNPETGDFKVYPVIIRNHTIYVATINGEYNFSGNVTEAGNNKVVYIKAPALGSKNISNIYASSLAEAINIKESSPSVLGAIEDDLSEISQERINAETGNFRDPSSRLNMDAILDENAPEEEQILRETSESNIEDEGEENDSIDLSLKGDGETSFTEEDLEELSDKLLKCNKITEDFLLDYLFSSLEESNSFNVEYDREENIPKAKAAIARKAEEVLSNVPAEWRNIYSETTRKKLIIQDLVETLKNNIRENKTKVYTSLTKEEIC